MNTSKRVSWPEKHRLLIQLSSQPKRSKYLATLLFLVAIVLSIVVLGVGSGIFASIVMLMSVGCFVVLFFPFRYIGLIQLIIAFVVCISIELLF
ncbi:hypothetical protein [Sphingobacterium sp. LRF_L2]|uniref:hypothetical protein n=1 Tax=Sphingobacterium sp. LRF_L2 TaxID=3369421 RepID=UPI003F5F2F4A